MALEFFTKGMKYDDIFTHQMKAWEARIVALEKETKFNAGLATELRILGKCQNEEHYRRLDAIERELGLKKEPVPYGN